MVTETRRVEMSPADRVNQLKSLFFAKFDSYCGPDGSLMDSKTGEVYYDAKNTGAMRAKLDRTVNEIVAITDEEQKENFLSMFLKAEEILRRVAGGEKSKEPIPEPILDMLIRATSKLNIRLNFCQLLIEVLR